MAATQWAADLASDIGVPLVLAHVVEPVIVPPRWQELVADFESERVASGQRMLARLSASFRDTHTDCVVSVGRPADTIASLAVEYGAGLVVMGLANPEDSEPRKPGSIAYRVLRTRPCCGRCRARSAAQAAPDRPASRGMPRQIARASRRDVAENTDAMHRVVTEQDRSRSVVATCGDARSLAGTRRGSSEIRASANRVARCHRALRWSESFTERRLRMITGMEHHYELVYTIDVGAQSRCGRA